LSASRSRGGGAGACGGGALLDGLAGALDLSPSRRLEEVDLPDPVHLPREPRQLLAEPRSPALEHLEVAIGQDGVVLVARLLEEANDVGLLHVLDTIHAEQGGFAAVALDLLGEPLELLVAVGGIGQQIGRALERHRAEHPQTAPGAHPQARRPWGQTEQ
jgi:AcrR family transcriptional regulator